VDENEAKLAVADAERVKKDAVAVADPEFKLVIESTIVLVGDDMVLAEADASGDELNELRTEDVAEAEGDAERVDDGENDTRADADELEEIESERVTREVKIGVDDEVADTVIRADAVDVKLLVRVNRAVFEADDVAELSRVRVDSADVETVGVTEGETVAREESVIDVLVVAVKVSESDGAVVERLDVDLVATLLGFRGLPIAEREIVTNEDAVGAAGADAEGDPDGKLDALGLRDMLTDADVDAEPLADPRKNDADAEFFEERVTVVTAVSEDRGESVLDGISVGALDLVLVGSAGGVFVKAPVVREDTDGEDVGVEDDVAVELADKQTVVVIDKIDDADAQVLGVAV
jgi:hypothetical protein